MLRTSILMALATQAGSSPLPQEPTSAKFPLPSTTSAILTSFSSSIPLVQTASTSARPSTAGIIQTQLNTTGHATAAPVSTISQPVIASPIQKVGIVLNPTFADASAAVAANIFVPIATTRPLAQFTVTSNHPVKLKNIVETGRPLQTNKFYTNFLIGSQRNAIWTHPYSLTYHECKNGTTYCGMSISHVERTQTNYGPGKPAAFFVNPIRVESIILSATQLGNSTSLTIDNLGSLSATVYLSPTPDARPVITMSVAQGMGFVTAVYTDAWPLIHSGVYFTNLRFVSSKPVNNYNVYKYRITLKDESSWLMYVRSYGAKGAPPFTLESSTMIYGPKAFTGAIQIAKSPSVTLEQYYDATAGTFANGATVSGSVSGSSGSYTLKWRKGGVTTQPLLMFALPHHVQSFDSKTRAKMTTLQLQTTTKGMATAILGDSITMVESSLPVKVGFTPANSDGYSYPISQQASQKIARAANIELMQDILKQADKPSMYWAGKALAKFAMAIYAAHQMGRDDDIAAAGLKNLTQVFSMFVNNKQQFPLYYDNNWGGLVSSASYLRNDPGLDYGNSYYNDHHFHYGYFVYAASVIAYFDPTWLRKGSNKAWITSLIRDYANPVEADQYFPFSRSFDWFHGHSWADGLFESADGKNEESSSEDAFSMYAIKMWAKVTGDPNMEARANLQLAILRRSFKSYFLMQSDNLNQPPSFIGQNAVGILFENKIDHTTYFGNKPEYIEGIHMMPLNPISAYTRSRQFVTEEWERYFSNGRANLSDLSFRAILYGNLALIDPKASWKFFADPKFDFSTLDTGASLTWYLAFAASLGGAP